MITMEMIKDIIDFRKVKRLVLYILICVLIALCSAAKQAHKDKIKYEAQLETQKIELTEEYEAKMFELKRSYEYTPEIAEMEIEAEYVAKVLYGTARYNSKDGQRAVVWCILNRVEHASYPNTVAEVCGQSQQWMGYSEDNPVLEELYEVALAELTVWHNDGHRPVSNDYIYLSWSSNEIVLRDTFEEKANTHYWRIR